jgi:hypothetical protein
VVSAMHIDVRQPTPALTIGSARYTPLHDACLRIADLFNDSVGATVEISEVKPEPGDGITSIDHPWAVLYRRMADTFAYLLDEPHEYFTTAEDHFDGGGVRVYASRH